MKIVFIVVKTFLSRFYKYQDKFLQFILSVQACFTVFSPFRLPRTVDAGRSTPGVVPLKHERENIQLVLHSNTEQQE